MTTDKNVIFYNMSLTPTINSSRYVKIIIFSF